MFQGIADSPRSLQSMEETAEDRLRLAFEMFEFGVDMQKKKLQRLHPDKSEEELDNMLAWWLQCPPSSPVGDCVGRVVHASRFEK